MTVNLPLSETHSFYMSHRNQVCKGPAGFPVALGYLTSPHGAKNFSIERFLGLQDNVRRGSQIYKFSKLSVRVTNLSPKVRMLAMRQTD